VKILFWSPYIGHVGTIKAVINSAISIKQNSNYDVVIIKNHSEWEGFENDIVSNDIEIVDFDLKKQFPNLHKTKFMGSRLYMLTVALFGFFQLRRYLKQERPDILITNLIALPAIMSARSVRHSPRIIASIQGYPKFLGLPDTSNYEWWMYAEDFLRKHLWNRVYKKVDKIVCMTKDTREKLIVKTTLKASNITVIENPVIDDNIYKSSKERIDNDQFNDASVKYIIAIGRLSFQKDFQSLIKAISIVKNNIDVKLMILGEGEDRSNLLDLIKELNLEDVVDLLGFTKNPYKFLKKSDLFVLSSRWEDPGHVLLEAATLKVPIVSTNCPSGPAILLENGKGGYMCNVEDPQDMANKIIDALRIKDNKKIIAAYNFSQRYTLKSHFNGLNKLIKEIV
jgi:glycosyltransferase involved in cell wall biosynthesis